MKLLAVESAFEACSVALWLDGEVLERSHDEPRGHAEHILTFVESLLGASKLTLGDLDALAFSRGPGSFTSLRIGIGVVQGLAFGARLGVLPVSSLRAVAQETVHNGVTRACVAMDARMDEVFTGCFEARDGWMQAVGAEQVCAPGEAIPSSPGLWAGVGNGFERYASLASAPMGAVHAGVVARAATVAALAAHDGQEEGKAPLPAEAAQPVYLRNRVAEKPRAPNA